MKKQIILILILTSLMVLGLGDRWNLYFSDGTTTINGTDVCLNSGVCLSSAGGSGGNTSEEIRDAVNGSWEYDINVSWNYLLNVPAGFADGVDNTAAAPDTWWPLPTSNALYNNTQTIDVNTSYIQRRLANCSAGSSIREVNIDGSVVCETDTDTDTCSEITGCVEKALINRTDINASDLITRGPWVDVRSYGAVGDGVADDTDAINHALGNNTGVILLPKGIYLISEPLKLGRGDILRGASTYDTMQNWSTQIKLADSSNTYMLTTPYARGSTQTHFMGVEDIYFNGNKDGQTKQKTCIRFEGVFVGSWLDNIFVYKCNGPALDLRDGMDLYIGNMWINKITSDNYSIRMNFNNSVDYSGRVNVGSLYIENTINSSGHYGKGILMNEIHDLNIQQLHMEKLTTGIVMNNSKSLYIGTSTWGAMGNTSDSKSSGVYLMTTPANLDIGYGGSAYSNTGFTFVKSASGVDSRFVETKVSDGSLFEIAGYHVTEPDTESYLQVTNFSVISNATTQYDESEAIFQNLVKDGRQTVSIRNDVAEYDLSVIGGDGDKFVIYDDAYNRYPLKIEPNTATNALYLDNGGGGGWNIGMGTNSPGYKLDVRGGINCSTINTTYISTSRCIIIGQFSQCDNGSHLIIE